jgi:hypothetical protein
MSNGTIIYRHIGEPSPCGGVAFYLDIVGVVRYSRAHKAR